jgi:Flp pilus assembly protein TadG
MRTKAFATRLVRDTEGATLALTAAAVLALIGMVGGAIDIGRSYMAQSRLQQACDAGALAARKAMAGESLTDADKAVGYRFFDFNFPAGTFGVNLTSRAYVQPTNTAGTPQAVVSGIVIAEVPTTLMRVFGNDAIDLQINCSSKMDIANADVAMVLDVTGSMDGHMRMSSSSSGTESRLSALRKSVKAFYDALGAGRAGGDLSKGRIRYAFVPYGTVVNTGYLLSHDQMVDRHDYQSREAAPVYGWEFKADSVESELPAWSEPASGDAAEIADLRNFNAFGTQTVGKGTGTYTFTPYNKDTPASLDQIYRVRGTDATQAQCANANTMAGGNLAALGRESYATNPKTSYVDDAPVYTDRNTYDEVRVRNWTGTRAIKVIGFRYVWLESKCRLTSATGKSVTQFSQTLSGASTRPIEWTYYGLGFDYIERNIDVSGLKGWSDSWNNTITVPALGLSDPINTYEKVKRSGRLTTATVHVGSGSKSMQVTWRGCIEERQMDPTITATTSTGGVPEDAYDLNTNLLADRDDDASRWRPWIHSLVYQPDTFNPRAAEDDCPSPALKLQEIGSYNDTIIESNYPNLFDDAAGGATSFYYPYASGSSNRWKNQQTIRNYIDRIKTTDGTLHDAGFIWGLHLVSGEGMFAGENPDRFNGQLVSRNIVFMTDGEMNPGEERYVFSGYNQYDGRLAPKNTSDSNMKKVHNRRLRILCEAAKRQGITVWVVVITDNTTQDYSDLRACASSSGNYKSAATSQELIASFTTIAQSIGGLRISQ